MWEVLTAAAIGITYTVGGLKTVHFPEESSSSKPPRCQEMGCLILHTPLSGATGTHYRDKPQVRPPLPQPHSSSHHTDCPQLLLTPLAEARQAAGGGDGASGHQGVEERTGKAGLAKLFPAIGLDLGREGTCVCSTDVASAELLRRPQHLPSWEPGRTPPRCLWMRVRVRGRARARTNTSLGGWNRVDFSN